MSVYPPIARRIFVVRVQIAALKRQLRLNPTIVVEKHFENAVFEGLITSCTATPVQEQEPVNLHGGKKLEILSKYFPNFFPEKSTLSRSRTEITSTLRRAKSG
jgi:hypothetical protein